MTSGARGLTASFAGALLASVATAGSPPARLEEVREKGAALCPAPKALQDAIAVHLGYDPFREPAERVVSVRLRPGATGLTAALTLRDSGGQLLGERQLSSTGTDCRDLGDSLALAISIALDPIAAARTPAALAPATPAPSPAVPPPAPGPDAHVGNLVELIVDKDQPYASAGYAQGLALGQTLAVAGGPAIGRTQEHRDVGTAKVVELWENLARLELNPPAAGSPGKRWVRLSAAEPRPAPAPAPPPAAPAPDAGTPSRPRGSATLAIRAGLAMWRIYLHNDGPFALHECELKLPDNRHFLLLEPLPPKGEETVMLFRFTQSGAPLDVPLDWLLVQCLEGARRVRL